MPDTVDDLYDRWQKNPDAARTAALCDALRGSARLDLVEIVGSFAASQKDVATLLAAGRMYTHVGRLEDAQAVLVSAGHIAPRDGEVFRWLGEVLLRRGDAERAERVLARAVQFAGTDPAAGVWLAQARRLVTTQRSSGMVAVAEEVAARPAARSFPSEEPDTLVRHDRGPDVAPPKPVQTTRNDAPPLASVASDNEDEDAMEFARSVRSIVAASSAGWKGNGAPATSDASISVSVSDLATLERPVPSPSRAAEAAPPSVASNGDARANVPEAREVLDALRLVGVFEPEGTKRASIAAGWDKPERGRLRIKSLAALIALALLTVGASVGTLRYVKDKRERQHVEAEALLGKVEEELLLSDARLLDGAEKNLSVAFDLDSRSPRAAIAWLRERGVRGLLEGGEDIAFQDAIARAREVGIPESDVAFANVASFLFQRDVAGAVDAVAKWDGVAHGEPWFELFAGAAFERAGDPRAIERYRTASERAPKLLAASMLLARAKAFEGDPTDAAALATSLRASSTNRPEADAFALLAWASGPERGDPPLAPAAIEHGIDGLPQFLKAIPLVARALVVESDPNRRDTVRSSLSAALGTADAPTLAVRIGRLAIDAGQIPVARSAAITALSMSPMHAPARVLAARVALLEGQLDDAAKAAAELPANDPDVRALKAVIAYERTDLQAMNEALEGLPENAAKEAAFVVLARGRDVLAGRPGAGPVKASSDVPWSEEIAVDAALDAGDLDAAAKRTESWREIDVFRASRVARLARYRGRLDDADRWSQTAIGLSTPTLRSLVERVRVLVTADKSADALALIKSAPGASGPAGRWLRAYALAAGGKIDEARATVAQEDPPGDASPALLRALAASAYGAMKDTKHGRAYVEELTKAGNADPDVRAAAEALGASKGARRKR